MITNLLKWQASHWNIVFLQSNDENLTGSELSKTVCMLFWVEKSPLPVFKGTLPVRLLPNNVRLQSVMIISVKFHPYQQDPYQQDNFWSFFPWNFKGLRRRKTFENFHSLTYIFWLILHRWQNFHRILRIFDLKWLSNKNEISKNGFGRKPEVLPVLLRDPNEPL